MLRRTCFILLAVVLALTEACPACEAKKGKYPVVLDNCGPPPAPLPVINKAPAKTPVVEKPLVELPACIPSIRTLDHRCRCVKTVVKPQTYRQLIVVPVYQRYVRTFHKPVVETICYSAAPVCPPDAPCAPCAPRY